MIDVLRNVRVKNRNPLQQKGVGLDESGGTNLKRVTNYLIASCLGQCHQVKNVSEY